MNSRSGLLAAAFETVPFEVAILDDEGDVVYTNAPWESFAIENGLVGDPASIGENYLDAIDQTDPCTTEIYETIAAVIGAESEHARLEYPCHSPERQRWFMMYARPFEAEGERYVQIGHLDITERKLAEIDVRETNERLSAVASILGHDLRGPLNVAMGRLDSLSGDPDHVEAVRSALNRIDTIVDDALVLARQPDPESLQPLDLAEHALVTWENVVTGDASIEVVESITVEADDGLLASCLENLFRNAIEHGGSEVTVRVGPLADGFYVEDDGVGIPAEDRERIFESGFTTGDRAVNTGLGLLIVQAVCRAHDWSVSVSESEAGGARFEITGVTLLED
jgi:signal transduction histidine kinase